MDSMTRAISLGLVLMSGLIVGAQAPAPPPMLASCSAPPAAEMDTWPVAGTDSIGATTGAPIIFSAVTLLANDSGGPSLTVRAPMGAVSSHGGTITGMDPFVYTPPASFVGTDVFTYEVSDAPGRSATGIVHVDVNASAPRVAVPNVTGQPEASATSAIGALGLTASISRANSTSVAIGTVVSQLPAGGTSVTVGSSVSLVVSLGALVPNVVGGSQTAAAAALQAAGLQVGTVTLSTNTTVPAGTVLSQSPLSGVNAAPGSGVNLVVSRIVATNPVVPTVVGQSRAAAAAAITGAGLTVGNVTFANNSTIAYGSIVSTSPVAGTSLAPGSAVGMVVSLGADGLVLALGFDESDAATAIDSSAVGKNGAIQGAVHVAGVFGSALSFNGLTDWVTLTDGTGSPLDLTNGMTIEAWVKPTELDGWDPIVIKERAADSLSYALYGNDGSPDPFGANVPANTIRVGAGDMNLRGPGALPLNTWTHVAITYNGSVQSLFVNGVRVAQRAQTGNIVAANGALRIGGDSTFANEFFKGLIDEVRIYNRARTAAQISGDMNTPIVR